MQNMTLTLKHMEVLSYNVWIYKGLYGEKW